MSRLERAETLLEAGDFDGARRLLGRARVSPFEAPQRDFLAAEALRAQGFFAAAQRLYGRLLSSRIRAEDPALWIEAGLALASCRRSLGDAAEACRLLRSAKAEAARRRWRSFLPLIRLEEALVDRAAGKYAASIAALEPILRGHLGAREWADAAFVLWALGGALRFRGDLEKSREAFARSKALARRARDPQGEAYALFGLGGVTRILGRLGDSAKFYAEAGRRLSKTQDIFGQAYAQCGLANALRQLGRLDEAERHYRRSHRLYSKLEDEVDLAYVEWGLGKIELGRGAVSKAIPFLARALKLFKRHHEDRGEVLAGVALAQALHAAGRTKEAERLFLRAYALAGRAGLHAHLEIFT